MKRLVAILLAVTIVFVLTACGAKTEASPSGKPAESVAVSETPNKNLKTASVTEGGYQINTDLDLNTPVTLDIVGPGLFETGEEGLTDLTSGIFKPGWNVIEARWNELYPNAKLNFNICPWSDWQSSITTACLDGQADIIMHGASLPDLTEDLAPYIQNTEGYREQIYVTAARRTTENPSVYKISGISTYTAPAIIWVDTQKFADFGVELPNDDWSIDEFVETAKSLTGTNPVTGEECYGIQLPFSGTSNLFFNYMLAAYGMGAKSFIYGDTMADCSVNFLSDESIEAFDLLAELAKYESPDALEGVSVVTTLNGENNWAMMGTNAAITGIFEKQMAGIDEGRYVAYNMPVISKGEYAGNPIPYFGDINIAMYNQSDAKDWAWEFIKFMTTDEVASQWIADQLVYPNNVNGITAVEGIMDKRTISVFQHAMSTMPEKFNGSTNDNFNNVSFGPVTSNLLTCVDNVLNGRMTSTEAAQYMQNAIDEYLATIK